MMHPDAYKLMHYHSPSKDQDLYIWNARDGAAPHRITLFSRAFVHIDPDCDVYLPDHIPAVGAWVFVRAELASSRPEDIPPDAPQFRQVNGQLWEYFSARAEGFLAGVEEERNRTNGRTRN